MKPRPTASYLYYRKTQNQLEDPKGKNKLKVFEILGSDLHQKAVSTIMVKNKKCVCMTTPKFRKVTKY